MLKNAVRRSANKLGFDIHRISKPFFPIRMEISPLLQGHVNGAVLYADRTTALELFPRGGVVAEIGVALGDFTELMLAKLKPSRLDAFDLFRLHESGYQGRSEMDLFDGLSHRAYYERRFANQIATGHLHLYEGDSSVAMKKQARFDL